MRNFWENPWFTIPVLLFFMVGLGVVFSVPYGYEIIYFNAWRQEPLNTFFRFCSQLGEAPVYYIAGIFALFIRFRWALLIFLMGLFLLPFAYYVKDVIGTERPMTYFAGQGIIHLIKIVPDVKLYSGYTSFPSGHTMSAFAFYGLLAMFLHRKDQWVGAILAYTAILVGVSRIYLVQHFMMDVLGGASIGLGIAWCFYHLHQTKWLQDLDYLDSGLLSKNRGSSKSKQKRNSTNEGEIP
jgi:membrane-associated phospholipid phosphatase